MVVCVKFRPLVFLFVLLFWVGFSFDTVGIFFLPSEYELPNTTESNLKK